MSARANAPKKVFRTRACAHAYINMFTCWSVQTHSGKCLQACDRYRTHTYKLWDTISKYMRTCECTHAFHILSCILGFGIRRAAWIEDRPVIFCAVSDVRPSTSAGCRPWLASESGLSFAIMEQHKLQTSSTEIDACYLTVKLVSNTCKVEAEPSLAI